MDPASCRAALAAAERVRRHGLRRRRPPPEQRDRLRRRRRGRARRARPRTRAAARSARPAWTTSATARRATTRSRRSRAQIEIARDDRQAARHPHARGRRRHDRHARRDAEGCTVVLHCFSMPRRLDECLEHGWYVSYAGNVTYPKSQALAATALRVAARPPARRDRRAVPDAAGRAQGAQPVRLRHRTPPRFIAELRGHRVRGARGGRRGQRRRGCSAGERRAPDPAEPAPPQAVRRAARTASSARTS